MATCTVGAKPQPQASKGVFENDIHDDGACVHGPHRAAHQRIEVECTGVPGGHGHALEPRERPLQNAGASSVPSFSLVFS